MFAAHYLDKRSGYVHFPSQFATFAYFAYLTKYYHLNPSRNLYSFQWCRSARCNPPCTNVFGL
jgi:hypothetical protein